MNSFEKIVLYRLLYQAEVEMEVVSNISSTKKRLENFLFGIVDLFNMKCVIPPCVDLINKKDLTGIVCIAMSHIAFHYWPVEKYFYLDIYSCQKFNGDDAINYITKFWKANNVKTNFIKSEL